MELHYHVLDHELKTSQDYRLRYASYRSDENLQKSHSKPQWLLVLDDHEVTDNSWLKGPYC